MSNALARLLTRVAKRVLSNNPTNEAMLEVADRVAAWSRAGYVGEPEVAEIGAALPDGGEPGEGDSGDAPGGGEPGRADAASVLASLGSRPAKAELLDAAEALGLDVPEGATNPEIYAMIEGAAR